MRTASFFVFFLIGTIGIVSLVFSENPVDTFIVKKTKQVVVDPCDHWCDLFGQLLQLLPDLDSQKSIIQKTGIKHIMQAMKSGNDVAIAQLPRTEQQAAVQELQKLIDQVHKTTVACEAYSKKLETLFTVDKKNKK